MSNNTKTRLTKITENPSAMRTIIIALITCILLIIVYIQLLKLFPNYNIFKSFYEESIVYVGLGLFSLFMLIWGMVFLKINPKSRKALLVFLLCICTIVLVNGAFLYDFDSNPIKWFGDLKYALNNNPPSTINDLESIHRYSNSGDSTRGLADLEIGDVLFTAYDTGEIKEFLDKYQNKRVVTVKAYYFPNTNIVISLEYVK